MFHDKLSELMKTSTDRSFNMSAENFEKLLQVTKQSKLFLKQYHRLIQFDILTNGDTVKLVESGVDSISDSKIRFICNTVELIGIVGKAQTAEG